MKTTGEPPHLDTAVKNGRDDCPEPLTGHNDPNAPTHERLSPQQRRVLDEFAGKFSQTPLDPDATRILEENLYDLI